MSNQLLITAMRRNRLFIVATTAFAVLMLGTSLAFGAKASDLWMVFWHVASVFTAIFLALPVGCLLGACKNIPRDLTLLRKVEYVLSKAERDTLTYFTQPRAADAIVYLACILPFFFSFIVGKSLVPVIHPYQWDAFFSHLDYALHGGHYPHDLLPQLHTSYLVIRLSEFAYMAWFALIPCINGYAVFFDDNIKRRTIFFWASFFLWTVGGNIIATVFSSVGPIFYGDFYAGGPNPYAGVTADMHAAEKLGSDLWPGTYDVLIGFYHMHIVCNLNAISAFPSMHVGMSMLTCLYGFAISRRLGIFLATYTMMILAASIILGMHYAVDGYFIILLMAAVWWGLHRFMKTPVA